MIGRVSSLYYYYFFVGGAAEGAVAGSIQPTPITGMVRLSARCSKGASQMLSMQFPNIKTKKPALQRHSVLDFTSNHFHFSNK